MPEHLVHLPLGEREILGGKKPKDEGGFSEGVQQYYKLVARIARW